VLIFCIPIRFLPFTILTKTDWIRIATEIELNYTSFDAFVVLHGTDTMSYTSSALSFLLEDLGKTVVRLASSNDMIILRHETRSLPELKYPSHNFGTTLSTIFLVRCLSQATTPYQVTLMFQSCSCCLSLILECSLYFNHTLYRGNRVSKASSYDLDAFHSPNFPPLVNGARATYHLYSGYQFLSVGIDIVVNWNDVLRQTSLRRFRAYKGRRE
jgi:lysophospholipase